MLALLKCSGIDEELETDLGRKIDIVPRKHTHNLACDELLAGEGDDFVVTTKQYDNIEIILQNIEETLQYIEESRENFNSINFDILVVTFNIASYELRIFTYALNRINKMWEAGPVRSTLAGFNDHLRRYVDYIKFLLKDKIEDPSMLEMYLLLLERHLRALKGDLKLLQKIMEQKWSEEMWEKWERQIEKARKIVDKKILIEKVKRGVKL